MKKLLVVFLILIFFAKAFAQQNNAQAALYNVGFGFVLGGVGALINKKPNEKWHKTFIKGAGQGSLGGLVIFGSKHLLSKIPENNNLAYAWPSKFIYSAGNSIIENATSNRNFWENWHIVIGFNRIEFEISGSFKVKYNVLPVALFGTIYSFKISDHLDLATSLKIGAFVFKTDKNNIGGNSGAIVVNTIVLQRDLQEKYYYEVLTHEIIHAYQYEDFTAINSFFNPLKTKYKNKSEVFKKINNWIYFDFQAFILYGLYNLEKINAEDYYDNFFEHEAGYYSNTINWK